MTNEERMVKKATGTLAITYCTKLVLEIDPTIDSYLTAFLE